MSDTFYAFVGVIIILVVACLVITIGACTYGIWRVAIS